MQERNRAGLRQQTGGSGSPLDDTESEAGGLVTVSHAPYAEDLPVGELSIQAIRQRYGDRLDIHPEAVALVDGQPAGEDTLVHEGQNLMFVRPAGEKGRH